MHCRGDVGVGGHTTKSTLYVLNIIPKQSIFTALIKRIMKERAAVNGFAIK